jgi:hypothetical protein
MVEAAVPKSLPVRRTKYPRKSTTVTENMFLEIKSKHFLAEEKNPSP